MGSKAIDHEVKGHMGYWLKGHDNKRNNCFNKIQPFGQMLSQLCTWIRKPLIKKSRKINNVDIELNNKVKQDSYWIQLFSSKLLRYK